MLGQERGARFKTSKLGVAYQVEKSPTLTAQLDLLEKRAATSKVDAGLLKVTKEMLQRLSDPKAAFSRDHCLRDLPGCDLRNIWRVKGGRHRIFYIASSAKERVAVLFIGYRKERDQHDAYV